MRQIIIDFGTLELFGLSVPLRFYGYGLMLVLGFLLGIVIAQRRARRMGENPDLLVHCGILALIGGVIGARIAFVIENWRSFRGAPLSQVMNITSGGLIYYGGVILATILVLAYLRVKRLPIRRFLDILAPSLMIGLAFGRAGCTLNGCCYGGPASANWPLAMQFPMYSRPLLKLDGRTNPWSVGQDTPSPPYSHQMDTGRIRPDDRLYEQSGSFRRLVAPRDFTPEQITVALGEWSHPLKPAQVLGMINAFLLAILLVAFTRLRRREGQVFALMVIMYPITRFILESIRDDNPHNLLRGILTHNQYTSLAIVAVGLIMMAVLHHMTPSAGPAWSQRLCAAQSGDSSGDSSGGSVRPRRRSKKR